MTASELSVLSLWGAFALGLAGGFGHCLAMCGPFVAGASLATGASTHDGRWATTFQVTYHVGRLGTYTLIGSLLGLLGGSGAIGRLDGPFSPESLTRYLKLSVGAVTLTLGLVLFVSYLGPFGFRIPEPTALLTRMRWFPRATGHFARLGGVWGLPLGALMGLLPCAPLLPAELAALATGEPLWGALVMLAFGLGTVPALASFGTLAGLVGAKARGWILPASALLVAVLGGVTIAQGLQAAAS